MNETEKDYTGLFSDRDLREMLRFISVHEPFLKSLCTPAERKEVLREYLAQTIPMAERYSETYDLSLDQSIAMAVFGRLPLRSGRVDGKEMLLCMKMWADMHEYACDALFIKITERLRDCYQRVSTWLMQNDIPKDESLLTDRKVQEAILKERKITKDELRTVLILMAMPADIDEYLQAPEEEYTPACMTDTRTPEYYADQHYLTEVLNEALNHLGKEERTAVELCYGLKDGREKTVREAAKIMHRDWKDVQWMKRLGEGMIRVYLQNRHLL